MVTCIYIYIGLSPLTLTVTTIQTTKKTQARWTQNTIEKLGWHILSVYQPTKKLGFHSMNPIVHKEVGFVYTLTGKGQ